MLVLGAFFLRCLQQIKTLRRISGQQVREIEITVIVELVGQQHGPVGEGRGQIGRAEQVEILPGQPGAALEHHTVSGGRGRRENRL